ncbi:unnamed protein product [Protopolystoma xenopodis]|uniref:Uncharacterized protein n=1 Tax=Protopolystoma xenopodis TaxID=117903 RepID=A0A3S5A3S8_9PLAT|nr:unnamed protein product [Protopolystoma xenopodis]
MNAFVLGPLWPSPTGTILSVPCLNSRVHSIACPALSSHDRSSALAGSLSCPFFACKSQPCRDCCFLWKVTTAEIFRPDGVYIFSAHSLLSEVTFVGVEVSGAGDKSVSYRPFISSKLAIICKSPRLLLKAKWPVFGGGNVDRRCPFDYSNLAGLTRRTACACLNSIK